MNCIYWTLKEFFPSSVPSRWVRRQRATLFFSSFPDDAVADVYPCVTAFLFLDLRIEMEVRYRQVFCVAYHHRLGADGVLMLFASCWHLLETR